MAMIREVEEIVEEPKRSFFNKDKVQSVKRIGRGAFRTTKATTGAVMGFLKRTQGVLGSKQPAMMGGDFAGKVGIRNMNANERQAYMFKVKSDKLDNSHRLEGLQLLDKELKAQKRRESSKKLLGVLGIGGSMSSAFHTSTKTNEAVSPLTTRKKTDLSWLMGKKKNNNCACPNNKQQKKKPDWSWLF